ncbi:hypothetical protein [Blastococcus saxobsidens]|uniref:Uncharacterized protein n=1 Tax=Blastococcus saxobsidens TaxID=138336 RepID=A0A4Q7Y6R0_9ACTN|nr:hypothetical protein [Blastococcus saxobsidens]RZU32707.1 hypothetical protein BKA19_2409 [Blastococcus saxobsidens]
MPANTKTAATPTREQIEREVAEAEQRAAMLREQIWREDEAKRQRREDAERDWDEQFLASHTLTKLEDGVTKAAQALDQELASNPLVLALAGYYAALRRRSNIRQELSSARMRVGQQPLPTQTMQTEITAAEVLELILRTAARIATDQVSDEVAGLYAGRQAAGAAAEQG